MEILNTTWQARDKAALRRLFALAVESRNLLDSLSPHAHVGEWLVELTGDETVADFHGRLEAAIRELGPLTD